MKQVELKYGAWYAYTQCWMSAEDAADLKSWLEQNLEWEERTIYAFDKPVIQPRLMSWCGAIPYQYSGQTLPPRPMPQPLLHLRNRLEAELGVPFNHIVLNRYRDGQDHMSLHADNEPELGRNPTIAAVSLGGDRVFKMVPKPRKGRYKHQKNLVLEHGSLFVMGGRMQHTWRHAVPKGKKGTSRINLTLRYLRGAPGWRDPLYAAQRSGRPSGLQS